MPKKYKEGNIISVSSPALSVKGLEVPLDFPRFSGHFCAYSQAA